MLQSLSLISLLAVVISGFVVLYVGDWKNHAFRYGAIALSTASALFIIFVHFYFGENVINLNEKVLCNYELSSIFRNTALLMFHVIVGRDAVCHRDSNRTNYRFVHNVKK